MKNVLLLDKKNYKSQWLSEYELQDKDQLIGKIKPKLYFDKEVYFVLKNNNNSNIFEIKGSKWNNVNFLKSHLQKCIRLNKPKLAVKTSFELINLDSTEFLRRLPIIMIEDSDLFSFFPTIIWFMVVVTKGYKLKDDDVYWLLKCVKKIAKCKSKFNSNLEEPEILKDNNNIFNNCLLLRINYGGMKGDLSMLKKITTIINDYKIIKSKIKLKNKKSYKSLKLDDCLVTGMDFHVNPRILYDIQNLLKKEKNIYMNVQLIKSWMWLTRSRINKRIEKEFSLEKENPLKDYHKKVDDICFDYIKKYYIK